MNWTQNRLPRRWLVGLLFAVLAGLVVSVAAERPIFTKNQKAFYLTEQELAFIRPGLLVKIMDASIDEDGTIQARFTATDPRGLPLDRTGIFTPGAVSTSWIAAVLPAGEDLYTAYTTRMSTSPITNDTAIQASSDSGGTYEKVADGEYMYTFATRAPLNFDRGATHTIGVYARRDLTEFDLGQPSDDDTFNFVPDGSEVTKVRDIVRTATCNSCHTRLTLHGRRHSTELCIMCHQPQSTDPDTGNTVDMATMIHKIHMGAELPSVQAGTPYQIIGFRQSVHDYSTVEYPADVRRCETCHTGGTQSNVYLTNPSRRACGSCHDNVNFATGENHADLPQVSDNQCNNCHIPEGELEYDISIIGAHTIEEYSKELKGVNIEFVSVTDTAPGRNPTATFTALDDAGNPLIPSEMNRLRLMLAGNTTDISQYWSEDAGSAEGSGGTYAYTFERGIPEDAEGSWLVGVEARNVQTLLAGTTQERTDVRDAADNTVFYFPVTDAEAKPRRAVVAQEKCDACHYDLSLHGNNRNAVEYCVACHNPLNTDETVRPEGELPIETINFKQMIHKIHTGEEIDESLKPYVIFGFRGSRHEFSEVRFPGDRRECTICHVDGTQQLPLQEGLLSVEAPRDHMKTQLPISGACLSCHTNLSAAAHADINTSPNLGESCDVCHGPDADFSVDRMHAR